MKKAALAPCDTRAAGWPHLSYTISFLDHFLACNHVKVSKYLNLCSFCNGAGGLDQGGKDLVSSERKGEIAIGFRL